MQPLHFPHLIRKAHAQLFQGFKLFSEYLTRDTIHDNFTQLLYKRCS